MRRMRFDRREGSISGRCLLVAAFLAATLHAAPAVAARIVVFGDSWGVPAAPALQAVLAANGLPDAVTGAAVGGETAANLSSTSGLQHQRQPRRQRPAVPDSPG